MIRVNLMAYFRLKKDLFAQLEERLKASSYWLEGGRLIGVQHNGEEGLILTFAYKLWEVREVHIPWSVVNSWE